MQKNPVEFDQVEIRFQPPDGLLKRITWAELRGVLIETNAAGPFAVDWYWILVGQDGGCVIPGEAMGGESLLEGLQKLPGFDNDAFIEAMSCVEERRFLCWKRAD